MTVKATKQDLEIPRGRYWSRTFAFQQPAGTPVDLTGFTVLAQVRESLAHSSAKIIDLTASHDDAGGVVTLSYDDSARGITARSGSWDLVLVNPAGQAVTYLEGTVSFTPTPTEVP